MFLAFVASGHYGEHSSCKHFTIKLWPPFYLHFPVRCTTQGIEPASKIKSKKTVPAKRPCRSNDQSKTVS